MIGLEVRHYKWIDLQDKVSVVCFLKVLAFQN